PGGGKRLHGARRSADGRADHAPAPAAPVARRGAQVSVDAGVQEPDHARGAGDRHLLHRESRSERSVRSEGSRTGTAAAGDAGGGERRLRRGGRARRRGAHHAGENSPGHQGGRSARRAGELPGHRVAGGTERAAAMGGRRRASHQREAAQIAGSGVGSSSRAGDGTQMMRASHFRYYVARDASDAVAALAGGGPRAMLLAGGTDIVPNMKRRQQTPELLISLRRAADLRAIAFNGETTIGACTTLSDLVRNERLRAQHHALYRATAQVATPLIR